MGKGQPLNLLTESVIQRINNLSPQDRRSRSERKRLFFEVMMRVVDRVKPGYADRAILSAMSCGGCKAPRVISFIALRLPDFAPC
jgi:hypothetical protein